MIVFFGASSTIDLEREIFTRQDIMTKQLSLPFEHHSTRDSFFGTWMLISLKEEYFTRIVSGHKHFEYRRKYRREATAAFIYVSLPIGEIRAIAQLGEPIIAPPDEIAQIAESDEAGIGAAVFEYLSGLEYGYAIPIEMLWLFTPLSLKTLRKQQLGFVPPQSYSVLERNPRLLSYLLEHADQETRTTTK